MKNSNKSYEWETTYSVVTKLQHNEDKVVVFEETVEANNMIMI